MKIETKFNIGDQVNGIGVGGKIVEITKTESDTVYKVKIDKSTFSMISEGILTPRYEWKGVELKTTKNPNHLKWGKAIFDIASVNGIQQMMKKFCIDSVGIEGIDELISFNDLSDLIEILKRVEI